MRSIQRRFNNIANKNPNYSSYLCFAEAIKGQNFNEQAVRRWFHKLVGKDDYFKEETGQVLRYLVALSKNA